MDVIRLCRLCLTFSEYHANIFFDKIKDKEMWRLINSICELNTFLYDGLPEHICVDCVYTLKKTLSFRNRAIEATSALKLMIQRNKDLWEKSEFDSSKSSKSTPKAVQVETLQGTKAVVQPAVATPPSTRSTTVNKVSGMGSVAYAIPKKSKCLRSSGKNSQRKSNSPFPGRNRTVKVETPSCDDNKQGPSSEKDPMQQSFSEHQSGAENKAACPFVCQQCGASYVRKHFLQKHEVAHRNDWTSTTWGLRLQSKMDLNSHMQFHSHARPYSTMSSDLKNFPSLEASEETARNSFEGESSSICTSQDISDKNRDTDKGMPENDLRCDAVPVEESLSSQISKIMQNVTKSARSNLKAPLSKRKSGFICDICKKSFQYKVHLGRHVRVHYDDRPFSCTICDKTFKQEVGRFSHELTHLRPKMSVGESEKGTNKMLYSCDLCTKNFSSKFGLWRHSNLHSNKFKCNSCGKCFGDSALLRRHLTTHTKEKPFQCEFCLKCFSLKCSLNAHFLIHSSERPHICEICDKRFKSKREKTVHALHHLRKK